MQYWTGREERQDAGGAISIQVPTTVGGPIVVSTIGQTDTSTTSAVTEGKQDAGWFSIVNRARVALGGVSSSQSTPTRRMSWRAVSASIQLLDGQEILLEVSDGTKVQDLKHWCTAKTGVPVKRQRLVIHEAHNPQDYSIANLTRSLSYRALYSRKVVAEWASFFFLPEALSRELKGSGVINWTYRKLRLCLKTLRGESGSSLVYVGDAAGNHAVMEVGCEVMLSQLSAAVEKEAHIAAARQRITLYEMKERSYLRDLVFQIILRQAMLNLSLAQGWLSLARYAMSLPFSKGWTEQQTLSITVTVAGREISLNVPASMTLQQLLEEMNKKEQQFLVTRIC